MILGIPQGSVPTSGSVFQASLPYLCFHRFWGLDYLSFPELVVRESAGQRSLSLLITQAMLLPRNSSWRVNGLAPRLPAPLLEGSCLQSFPSTQL